LIDAVNSFWNGYNASWTFSPNPELPGSLLTFTATAAACGNCTLPFSYFWDFSSLDSSTYVAKVDATGQTVTITPPSPVVNRVTLTVRDAASHSVNATRRLPLNAIVTGPTTVAQGVTSTAFTGKWLGGVVTGSSGYSGQWRFCPGSVISHPVCSRGPITISQNPGSINQTSKVSSVTWNFAGLYNDFMSISDTAVGQISPTPNTVIAPIPVNVTGNTPAYIVTVSPSVLYIGAGQSVNFSITVAYDPSYPTGSQSTQFKYLVFGGDGRAPDSFTGTNSVSHLYAYSKTGSYVAKVVVQETSNNAPSMIQEIGYSPPLALVASFVFTPPVVWLNRGGVSLPSAPVVGDTISFNATVLGGDAPYAYSWNFGDGTTGSGSSISHKYSLAGDYKVSLTVTDSKSKIFSVVHSVSIASSQAAELPFTYIAGAGIAAAVVAAGLLLFVRRRKTVGPTVGGPTV
jgi:chitodextrinase